MSAARKETFTDLAARGVSLWIDAARTMQDLGSMERVRDRLRTLEVPLPAAGPLTRTGCEVPPPCWWPREAGAVTSYVCEGATATLRIEVANCGPERRRFRLEAPEGIELQPTDLELGAMERGVVTARRESGGEALLWVRGCYEHVVRWTVVRARRGTSTCHEVQVEDCPDYRHHWYDHFYCDRPCPAEGRG